VSHSLSSPRVIFLLSDFGLGGSERKVVKLATRLAAEGASVGCAYMQRPDTLAASLPESVPRWFLDRRARLSPGVLRGVSRLAGVDGGATVVAVNQYPALYAAVLRRFAPRRVPRAVCLMNTGEFERARDAFFRPLYAWALRQMDVVVYGSEGQRALWDQPGSRSWHRSQVLYNGVDLQRFDAAQFEAQGKALRAECGVTEGRLVFGSSGRLAPEKNYAVLVDALAGLRSRGVDAHLLIVGEGPMRPALEALARERGVAERMSLIGSREDVRPALAAMDVFVLPSTNETFSNAALEAMSMGLPAILSRVGGAPEMVTDGVQGHLLDVQTLRESLIPSLEALAKDTGLRRRMGEAARVRVASQFADQQMITAYRSLLRLSA
jgi:glycosyltransferase involved in cell wall biosynthesis